MSLEWRHAKDSLNAKFSSEHKTKKSVDKTSHECSHESTRSPERDLQKTETQFHLRTKEMTAVISKCPNQTMDQ